ncbi:neutral zinc metallopeptidase [Actinosynnema sp. NPDC020468]|uniref:neutral zinc metallopeptidase n=1 Tax=Actinosynnema sp. NPDC020468 TaxID=3154488 RepID=UPI0033CA08B2
MPAPLNPQPTRPYPVPPPQQQPHQQPPPPQPQYPPQQRPQGFPPPPPGYQQPGYQQQPPFPPPAPQPAAQPGTGPGGFPQQWPRPPMAPPPAAPPQPPPAQWSPQPGWPPQQPYAPYPPLPRKKSGGPLVAFLIIGVVVLGIAAVGIFATRTKNKSVDDSAYSGYSTYTYSAPPTTATTSAGPGTNTSPSTRTSPTTTTKAGPKAVIALGDNPIHSKDIGAFDLKNGCALPSMDYSVGGQETFLRAALPCIEEMWKPAFAKANLPYQPAELVMVTSQITNSCGSMGPDRTAMYCEGTIYWTPLHYAGETGSANPNHPGKYLGQLAHEYGHHIQWLSGILKASGQAQYDKGGWDTPAGLELNRRKELQATCFGGESLAPLSHGAVPIDVIQVAITDAGNRGDYPVYPNRDHGAPEKNMSWVQQGYKNNSTAACNTWTASAADVS